MRLETLVNGFAIKSAAAFRKYGLKLYRPACFVVSNERRALSTFSTEKGAKSKD